MGAPVPCSALALDVGRRRIGLAGCDPLGLTVTPLEALWRGSFETEFLAIEGLIRHRRVDVLVIGIPLDNQQRMTPQALYSRRYGQRLARKLTHASLPVPVAWVNEHGSTWSAGERFSLHGDRSGRLDSAAAVVILEQWLREGPCAEPVTAATIPPRAAAGSDSS